MHLVHLCARTKLYLSGPFDRRMRIDQIKACLRNFVFIVFYRSWSKQNKFRTTLTYQHYDPVLTIPTGFTNNMFAL